MTAGDAAFAATGVEPVPDGGILIVRLVDPGRGGQTVEITATDGGDPTDSHRFSMHLRGNGKGETQFIVPIGWSSIVLRCGLAEHEVAVAVPP